MDTFIVILIVLGLILLMHYLRYLIEKHVWNNGVSRVTGQPWEYVSTSRHNGIEYKFRAGDHTWTFGFRFDEGD